MNSMRYFFLAAALSATLPVSVSAAGDDLGMTDYLRDINKSADAHAVKVSEAWAENMAYRINHGMADGVVVDGKTDKNGVLADGVGNIIVREGANVGPIINKTDISNSNVIVKTDGKNTRY